MLLWSSGLLKWALPFINFSLFRSQQYRVQGLESNSTNQSYRQSHRLPINGPTSQWSLVEKRRRSCRGRSTLRGKTNLTWFFAKPQIRVRSAWLCHFIRSVYVVELDQLNFHSTLIKLVNSFLLDFSLNLDCQMQNQEVARFFLSCVMTTSVVLIRAAVWHVCRNW